MLIVGARRAMPRVRRVPVLAAAAPVSAARSAFPSGVATPSPLHGETLAAAAGTAYGGDTVESSRMADPSLGLLMRPDGCIAACAGLSMDCASTRSCRAGSAGRSRPPPRPRRRARARCGEVWAGACASCRTTASNDRSRRTAPVQGNSGWSHRLRLAPQPSLAGRDQPTNHPVDGVDPTCAARGLVTTTPRTPTGGRCRPRRYSPQPHNLPRESRSEFFPIRCSGPGGGQR